MELLREALGLTAEEARLAGALYRVRGNLGAAAGALGISPGAARTPMKTVMHEAGSGIKVGQKYDLTS